MAMAVLLIRVALIVSIETESCAYLNQSAFDLRRKTQSGVIASPRSVEVDTPSSSRWHKYTLFALQIGKGFPRVAH